MEPRRPYTFKDEDSALGKLVTAAHGLDRSWAVDGACFSYPAAEDGWTPWMAETLKPTETRKHSARARLLDEKARMALMICASCKVQYECASYAVESLAYGCIWGMSTQNFNWLRKQRDGLAIVDAGRGSDLPVDQWVTIRRRERLSV